MWDNLLATFNPICVPRHRLCSHWQELVQYDEATPVRMVLPLRLEHPLVPLGKIRRTSSCGSVNDDKNICHIEFESINVVWRLNQKCLSKWYFLLPLGSEGSPWGGGWVLRHPRMVTRKDKSERLYIWIVLRGLFHSLPTKGWLSQICLSWWHFWLLWGSEDVPRGDRWVMRHPRMVTRKDESERLNIWMV